MTITHSRALHFVSFVIFLAAFAVAEHWLKLGDTLQWATAGLAVSALAHADVI